MSSNKPLTVLAVDLDHTLIHTDMIYSGFQQILFKKFYLIPVLLYLLFTKGKPLAKKYLYDNSTFDLKSIPFNIELIKFIKSEKHNYDHTILISGSYHKYVQQISDYLEIFDSYAGTDLEVNMISYNKISYLNERFDMPIFDYIGDNKKDIPIWEASRKILVVDNGNIKKYISHMKYTIISKRY